MGDPGIATDLKDGIEDLVAELGQTVTIRRNEGTAFVDPSQKWQGTVESLQDYSAEVLILDYRAQDVDGTAIQKGDKRALIDMKSLAITPDDDCLFFEAYPVPANTGPWHIVKVQLTEIAGVTVVAELQLRQ